MHTIANGIEKTIQLFIVRQKTMDANLAIKSYKYRMAQQLLLEALNFAPGEQASLQPLLDDLGPLIQVRRIQCIVCFVDTRCQILLVCVVCRARMQWVDKELE